MVRIKTFYVFVIQRFIFEYLHILYDVLMSKVSDPVKDVNAKQDTEKQEMVMLVQCTIVYCIRT